MHFHAHDLVRSRPKRSKVKQFDVVWGERSNSYLDVAEQVFQFSPSCLSQVQDLFGWKLSEQIHTDNEHTLWKCGFFFESVRLKYGEPIKFRPKRALDDGSSENGRRKFLKSGRLKFLMQADGGRHRPMSPSPAGKFK